MISTRNLTSMSAIVQIKRLSQSLAMLDAIIEPEWQMRYYSFNAHWSKGKMMASMRNGCGDDYFIQFDAAGAIMKGFAHESPMSPYRINPPQVWPHVLDAVPSTFASFLNQPAFTMSDTTFCLWRRNADNAWQSGTIDFPNGDDPDGSTALLAILDGKPETYRQWAHEYYERDFDLNTIAQIYQHQPLSLSMMQSLNSKLSLEDVREDATEINYPLA